MFQGINEPVNSYYFVYPFRNSLFPGHIEKNNRSCEYVQQTIFFHTLSSHQDVVYTSVSERILMEHKVLDDQ